MEHHNERMCKRLEAVTNEDTLHPLTHDYWTLKPLGDFDNESSANSESVAEDKTTIKANLNEETETDDEKSSDGNDGMDFEDGKDNDPNDAQISSKVDDIVRSQEKSDAAGGADGIDRKEKMTKKNSKKNRYEKFPNKIIGETNKHRDKCKTACLLNPVIAQESSVKIEEAKDNELLQGETEETKNAKGTFHR